jgi:hypothetical protein
MNFAPIDKLLNEIWPYWLSKSLKASQIKPIQFSQYYYIIMKPLTTWEYLKWIFKLKHTCLLIYNDYYWNDDFTITIPLVVA